MIDIHKEDLVNLADGRLLPRRPSYNKLSRWANMGILGKSRRREYLETVKIGGECCTSQEAYIRFCAKLSEEE